MVCVEVRTADRRADEMDYRIEGIGTKFGTSVSLTLTENIVPALRTAFVLPFPTLSELKQKPGS
jgi:hypothetical protein